jgi:iron complex transport system ATP-binding protein
LAAPGLVDRLRGALTAGEVVRCGRYGALEPWWHHYDDDDRSRAARLLGQVGLAGFDDRVLATLSSGERQRMLLARALMGDPEVVLLDEPTAGLDLAGREDLVDALDALASAGGPATVLVTHHLEDIPASTTHLLALRDGVVVEAGPVAEVLSDRVVSEVFGLSVTVESLDRRWTARATRVRSSGNPKVDFSRS